MKKYIKEKFNKIYYGFVGILMSLVCSNPIISADFAGTVVNKSNSWVTQIQSVTNAVATLMIVAAAFMLIVGQKNWAKNTIITVVIGYILIMSVSEFLALLQ